MTILQHFIVQDKINTIFVTINFAAVSDFMAFPGAKLLLAAIYKGQGYNEYNTKNRVNEEVWLNKNIKAFYRKT